MLYIISIFVFMISCGVLFIYFSVFPNKSIEQLIPIGRAETILDSMNSIVPENKRETMQEVRDAVALSLRVVSSVKSDEIACIVPEDGKKRQKGKIVLPEQSTYGNTDAVIESQPALMLENPLLNVLKTNMTKYDSLVSKIVLDMDARNDKFTKRMIRRSDEMKSILISLNTELVAACSEQRSRLKLTHPHLSHYRFKSESVHETTSTLPQYTFGLSAKPVSREASPVVSKDALVYEFYPYN